MTVLTEDDHECGKEAEAVPTPTYRSLAAPVSKPVDKFALLPAFLKVSITYSAPIKVDIEYTVGKQHDLRRKKDFIIGYLPIMLRSRACILNGKDEAELAKHGECPLDPGGYFVVKGTEKIPILVVMKAMGMESDQEVVQMVGRDPRYGDLLYPSIQATYPTAANEKEGRANSIIRDVFIAHVPVNNGNFRPKCIYTAVMLRRMMDAILNADTFDDKDLFKTTNHQAVDRMNKISDKTHSSPLDFSQVLSRLSYMASLGYMTRITPQFEKTRKTSGPRALQPSQVGTNLHIYILQIKNCYSLGVEDLSLLSGEEIHAPGSFLVMFNGLILGKHRQPQRFANAMRKLRRSGKIGEFVSIFVNEKQDGIRSFDDFLRDGLIEYLDVNEENNALIALYEHVDQDDVERSKITHIEIEPLSILGVVSGLIPYPHHNQSPRENSVYNLLQLFRADSLLYLLVYAQRPLLTTKTIELVGYDKLGAGQNATVAVMGYSGYDIEDAIVMNKSSLDRGFGRCIAMKKYTVLKDNYGDGVSDRIAKPQRDKDGALVRQNMRALDEDGIAAPGQIIRNHDIYVYKQTPRNTKKTNGGPLTDRSALYPHLASNFDSAVFVGAWCLTFRFLASRMTIGKMIELLGGKAGVSCGRFHYGSAFGEPSGNADKVEDISSTLIKHGFSYNGKDFLYSGVTYMHFI
ncbi:hypothetical protein PR202_gb09144 [Eleusine coracana subsp. coracana]|uniref:DNA-directed RNA polymerase n=1 Tax=Eleusine coracana subsp. coracana TaxID=191504 RepID=A0AAV5EHJ2_ELECO|nr:hypothetical protein PR202_gb09144 [Eleusine coracana subsp. coracana]